MTSEWKPYWLKDSPFKEASFIQVESKDNRVNGRIFDYEIMKEAFDGLGELIRLPKSICYVRSDDIALGTGKSALMAASYWQIIDTPADSERYLPVWVSVQDYKSINQLMSRVVETFVFAGIMNTIKGKLPEINRNEIAKVLGEKKRQILSNELAALEELLSMPDADVSWRYSSIRKKYSSVYHVELFTDLCILFGEADERRILVYIDQFEQYMLALRGSKMFQFGQDIKDLYRSMSASGNLSFIVSLHPNMELQYKARASDILDSYGSISENSVTVPQLNADALTRIAHLYMKNYRLEGAPSNVGSNFPFDDEVMKFVVVNSRNNPRVMIRILGNLLNEARLAKVVKITLDFVKEPKVLRRTGLDTASPEAIT